MSQSRFLSGNNPTSLLVRTSLAFTLILGLSIAGINSSNAVPATPTITTLTETPSGGTASVTVNFTPGDATLHGYQYSTDGGTTWAECNSSKCSWTAGNSYVVLQKMSTENNAMRNGSTYQIVIAACATGTPSNSFSTNRASLGLSGCGADSSAITYQVGTGVISASTPSISTSSTVANGAVNPTVVVTGSNFETTTSLSLFTIGVGTTGLTASSVVRNSATQLTFSFTGTAVAGTISIRALTTAYGPVASEASNTVTVTVPAILPETPTALSGSAASSSSVSLTWSAPSNDGGSAITDYTVQYTTETTTPSTWTTFTSSASTSLSRTVTGLSASTDYVFRVRAINGVGNGPYTLPSSVVTTNAASSTPPAPQPDPIYPPVISSISKTKVCARGQDEFIIRGSNFRTATVTVDGVAVTVKGNSDSTINLSFGETTEGIKTIKVTNSAGNTTTTVEFRNAEKTAFKVFDIPYIYKGGEFDYTFEAFGENTFWVTGNMPAGLVLDPATGRIYGTSTEEGKFNFVLHADGLCGNDSDVIKLDVDKEIPGAMTCRIKFQYKKINKLSAREAKALKDCIKHIKEISPKNIDPVIYISGGAPEGEPETESPEAKERRDAICDMLLTQDLIAQTIAGIFMGPDDEIEIMVYWPVTR